MLMLPLADCVSLVIRRLKPGKSPFLADRTHIHHYLLARGFTPSQALAILVGTSVLFGAAGYFGWLLKIQEAILFYPFSSGLSQHAWISVPRRRSNGGRPELLPRYPRKRTARRRRPDKVRSSARCPTSEGALGPIG